MANNAAAFQPGQQPGAEPSMEEILASIRRIIADDSLGTKKDETPAAAPPPPPRAAAAPAAPVAPAVVNTMESMETDPDSDVLDLAEVGTLAGSEGDDVMIGLAEDATAFDSGADMQESEIEAVPVLVEPPVAPVLMMVSPALPAPSLPTAAMPDPIISVETSGMVSNAFAHLARNTPMPAPGRGLEDIVAEMLRPMLREWMDSHLPGIVERLVRAEIERVARSG